MIRPKALKKGDKICLIGTCSPPIRERIEPAVNWFKSLGLNVVLGKSVYENHGYLCGEDNARAEELNEMFYDKEIKGIFIIRGGYGSARILDKIDFNNIRKNPKIFSGYSDVTALHIAINQKCSMVTFHTPMACTEFYRNIDDYTKESFIDNVFNSSSHRKIVNPEEAGKFESLVRGKASGRIVGGNLSVITSLMGTPYEIDTKNKILFLEDIDEPPYKIDRMLMQLKMGNKFKDAAGIILGSWKGCESKDLSKSFTLREVFEEIIVPEKKPAIMNISCGHCIPTMSIPLGDRFAINTEDLEITHLDKKAERNFKISRI